MVFRPWIVLRIVLAIVGLSLFVWADWRVGLGVFCWLWANNLKRDDD